MHFQLGPDDMARMQRLALHRVMRTMPRRWLVFGLRTLAWLALGLAFFRLLRAYDCCEDIQPLLQQAAYFAVAAAALLAASSYFWRTAAAYGSVVAGGYFTSPQAVIVETDGLRHTSRLGEFKLPWSAFVWRAEDERNFYLFVDQGIGYAFPKAAIPDLSEQARVREAVPE